MKYALLIYGEENGWDRYSDEEKQAMYAEYGAFGEDLRRRGWHQAGEELDSVSTATTVRVENGDTLVTDGPFAETKEQLGGFYLIDAPSLDDAIEAAARIPSARTGRIEVRPVVPH